MPKVKADSFIDLLGRSGLVDHEQITAALEEVARRSNQQKPDDSQVIADYLIEANLVTRWQAQKLLEGRHSGFFLSKYKLLDHIGTGGMSTVYLAEHLMMHRRVAIKVLPMGRVNDPAYVTRFQNEARAAGALSHPNIVHTYDIDNEGKIHYIVMEYVPGKNLQEVVKAEGPLGYRRSADYIAQAADGLAYAHEAKLVHRDVKPANLLVDERGVVKVLDLGLAYFNIEGQTSLTLASEDNVLGTADYLAPEQAVNSHNVDGRADIYGLGCTLYFLLTSRPPFDEGTIAQRLLAHQSQTPPTIYKTRPGAPPELVAICERMMAKDPARRFQSMPDVADALRRFMNDSQDAGSSGRLTRFGDSPSGLMRRPSGSSASRLGRDGAGSRANLDRQALNDSSSGKLRDSESSIFELESRGGSNPSKNPPRGGSGSGKRAPSRSSDEEVLELADVGDDKPHSASKSGGSKPPSAGSSASQGTEASAGDAIPVGAATPKKPADFGAWLTEELANPHELPQIDEPRAQRAPEPTGSGALLWIILGGAVALTLLLGGAVLYLLS
ncbi:MAG: protein kinase [Pirellulales bacterium]|nr:protein kinase [Pirellulales bacterium]